MRTHLEIITPSDFHLLALYKFFKFSHITSASAGNLLPAPTSSSMASVGPIHFHAFAFRSSACRVVCARQLPILTRRFDHRSTCRQKYTFATSTPLQHLLDRIQMFIRNSRPESAPRPRPTSRRTLPRCAPRKLSPTEKALWHLVPAALNSTMPQTLPHQFRLPHPHPVPS